MGFNRTFMELKFYNISAGTQPSPGFNRTFMELKYTFAANTQGKLNVLIVPLWNWNSGEIAEAGAPMSFNRTFMELK